MSLTDKALTYGMIYAHYQEFTTTNQYRVDPRHEICKLWDTMESLKSVHSHKKNAVLTWKDTGDVYKSVFEKHEHVLDTLLNVSKIHGGLQGLDSLSAAGEIVGSTASLSEMVRFDSMVDNSDDYTRNAQGILKRGIVS